ncbi:major membrane immunogen (membrane-anchored lipoprotein) [Caldicoprobacter guelmensis]|uniref:FMN-binding protein n=1 Tax=Caldicoprobacter guelmensis TaxID=1170224 RepID=UPI00195E67D7|nr:FMN-binding protein [Caldicoprobacter guelmensis]MBM7582528.1 major membrane immunogen (membrane-anchored lipoprotein) [Caldicoprobacter guelmensis]
MKKLLSVGLIVLLTVALLTACGGATKQEQGTKTAAYKDGVYKAEESQFDDHGWKGQIEIKVEGGKITEVKYDEVNQEGKKKSEDTEYHKRFKEQKNVDLLKAYETLEKDLVEKQDPDAVDTYTGATGTTTKFKTLAKEALKEAQSK